ncbi:hypothetical protein HBI79_242250 [Parastagonospora nodorum]|nr:hypothetical protein HBI79_242250 [Parastagonospora nodorum]
MIRNFSSEIAQEPVSDSWVTRFIHRHDVHLISKWATGLDRTRVSADSEVKYRLYFELLHGKMEEYNIEPGNTYNMDEKGFLIGLIGRSKRIFSQRQWEKKEVRAPLQDGSREFLTVLACCCADGSCLPPSLIYPAENGAIQSSWVEDVSVKKHQVFITSTPTGWSNDDVGLAWLEQVFDRHTKQKARRRRDYRLLILDGHGSHVTMAFIDYCDRNRILLMVFPPHSTHTLQPLDVVLFKPLSQAYTQRLTTYLHKAQGLISITKGDFFSLFWDAWVSVFSRETLISKAFETTGIWPKDPNVVLKRFTQTPERSPSSSRLSPSDWLQMQRLVRAAVKDTRQDEAKKLSYTLHQLSVQNQLLQHELKGVQEALQYKKKHKKKGKALNLQQRQEYYGGAMLWSPQKVREARAREKVRADDEMEEKLQKARRKEAREAAKFQRQIELEDRRAERERLKVVREKEKAKKQAERERQKQQRNAEKAIQLSQRGKRKASQAVSSKEKRQKRSGGNAAAEQAVARPQAPPPKVTSRGRNVKLPSKFK